jgi:hypothetical protein
LQIQGVKDKAEASSPAANADNAVKLYSLPLVSDEGGSGDFENENEIENEIEHESKISSSVPSLRQMPALE